MGSSSIGDRICLVHCRFDNPAKKLASIRHTQAPSAESRKSRSAKLFQGFRARALSQKNVAVTRCYNSGPGLTLFGSTPFAGTHKLLLKGHRDAPRRDRYAALAPVPEQVHRSSNGGLQAGLRACESLGGRVVENEALGVGRGYRCAVLVRLCKSAGRTARRWWRLFACCRGPRNAWRCAQQRLLLRRRQTRPARNNVADNNARCAAWRRELRHRRLRQRLRRLTTQACVASPGRPDIPTTAAAACSMPALSRLSAPSRARCRVRRPTRRFAPVRFAPMSPATTKSAALRAPCSARGTIRVSRKVRPTVIRQYRECLLPPSCRGLTPLLAIPRRFYRTPLPRFRQIGFAGFQTDCCGIPRHCRPKSPCQCDVSTPHFFENTRQQTLSRRQIWSFSPRRVIRLSSEPLSPSRAQCQ